jgi:outer membrane protein
MAALDLKMAKLDVADARADYWPEIDATGQYRFSDIIDFGWERQNYDAGITASYTIWDHGRREASLAQTKASEKAVQSDCEKAKQDLIFDITGAYYDLLQAEKLIDVNQKLLDISKGNVERVAAFQETGRAIPSEVAAARVQQANDELALINAQNNLELARARLASLMGLDPGIPIEIQDDPDYTRYTDTSLIVPDLELEDSVARAIQKRPELGRLQARLTSLEWSLRLARFNRWPVVTAQYGYNVLLDDYLRDSDNFKRYRNWSAVARISFPIFDGGMSKRQERNREIAVQQMKEDISERERTIALEVQQAHLDVARAKKSLDIAREQVKDATESLNVTQGRYEQNIVIFLEVLSAQARYAQALINQVRAFYDYKIAEQALQKAIGILQVDD